MNLQSYIQSLSETLNGSFSDYDDHTFIVVVPLPSGRYQSVKCSKNILEDGQTQVIHFSSCVCTYHDQLDFKTFLAENQHLHYSKFTIAEEFVQVEASVFLEFLTDDNQGFLVKMVREIAEQSDVWEHKLTGLDVF